MSSGPVAECSDHPRADHDSVEVAPGVTVHPCIHSGAPVVAGTRISTRWISGRFGAGETPEELADDYNVTVQQVLNAIRYELRIRIARRYAGLKPTRKKKVTVPDG